MTWVDLVLLAILGFSVLSGFSAGFARVSVGLVATVLGIFAACWFYRFLAAQVVDYVGSQAIANLIGFSAIYIAVAIVGGIVARLLGAAFKWVGLSWLDRLMGAGLGFVRGVLLMIAAAAAIMAFAPSKTPDSLVDSRLLPYVSRASDVLVAVTPYELKNGFHNTMDKARKLWDEQFRQRPGGPAKASR